jgi:signal transduction histidine kinase
LLFFVAGFDGSAHTGRGFDIGFLTLRIALPLLILPHLMGLYSAFKRRASWEGRVALPLFGSTLLFQLHDSAIFHGYLSGIYYVKWYPLVIGIVFGLFFLERAREARAKARVQQEQANQMRMIHEATVGLAHDLEEPFKSVEMGFIELQRNPNNHEIIKALAETFPKKLKRVYELNRAILSYSKELSTALTLEREQVNLKGFLSEIADEYRPQPALQGVELSVIAQDSLSVEIDPGKMRRVFRNLIRNAADACTGRPGSRITLEARSYRDGVVVLVSDNGPGIPAKIRDRLFQPFETYGKESGTGLGLAMSRRLVDAHGGKLELLESQVGACFQILLV